MKEVGRKQTNPPYRTYKVIIKNGHYVYGAKPVSDIIIELVEDSNGNFTLIDGRIYERLCWSRPLKEMRLLSLMETLKRNIG